jgi:hypothetical protein
MNRRAILWALAGGAAAALLPTAAWLGRAGLPPAARHGRHFVIGGWVLTARDVEAIRRHDA